jgi:hypothetical protein
VLPPPGLDLIKEYWPPGYFELASDKEILFRGYPMEVLDFDRDSEPGDTVPFLVNDDNVWFYTIEGISYFPGNDHIVSPKQFDLVFSHWGPLSEFKVIWNMATEAAGRAVRLERRPRFNELYEAPDDVQYRFYRAAVSKLRK